MGYILKKHFLFCFAFLNVTLMNAKSIFRINSALMKQCKRLYFKLSEISISPLQ